jgi:hypothetical protein
MKTIYTIMLAFTIISGLLFANPNYVGYSGAPASNGTCSSSCHAQNDFRPSCELIGFPTSYMPGQQYIILVRHNDGLPIEQFNCSVRKDSDSTIAGTLEGNFGTESYAITNETNGIHWVEAAADSGTFIWTAPDTLTGFITLYWAGLQGGRANGANQLITLTASEEGNSIDYAPELPLEFSMTQNYPNPFNSHTSIRINSVEPGGITVQILNPLGQIVYTEHLTSLFSGSNIFHWDGRDRDGNDLPSGLYFYQISSGEATAIRKMTILR